MRVIDSHTGGEPTRVILAGGPELGLGSLRDQARRLAQDHMNFCHSVLREPRGQPAMVGALLTEPTDPRCETGVIFFDAAAVLDMCGHGMIGLAVTLAHLGRIGPGRHLLETPAGIVEVDLQDANTATVTNVESRVIRQNVTLDVEGIGPVTGTMAYGGNWFLILESSPVPVVPANIPKLTQAAIAIRSCFNASGRGDDGFQPVDHVIFQGPSDKDEIYSRNFVLCPDDTYDRSPCGTGSSAFLACLAADGRLAPGQEILQESIIGSPYRLSYKPGATGGVIPSITGQAFVMADNTLIFPTNDPFRDGIPA